MTSEASPTQGHLARRWLTRGILSALFLSVAKDWLLSSVQPYPYEQSVIATVSLALPLFVRQGAWRIDPWVLLLGFGLLAWTAGEPLRAATLIGCCAVPQIVRPENSSSRWWAVGLLALCVAFAWRSRDTTLALAVGCAIAALGSFEKDAGVPSFRALIATWIGACCWAVSLWPAEALWMGQQLIGQGLGSTIHPESLSHALVADLGLIAFALFLFGVPLLALGAFVTPNVAYQPLAGALGVVGALSWLGLNSPSMLAVDSQQVGGTVAFSLALLALRHAALSGVAPKGRRGDRTKIGRWTAVAGGVGLGTLLIGWWTAKGEVARYLAGPLPAGYVRLSEIAPCFQDATVAMEDGHFYDHGPFDYGGVHRALRQDVRRWRVAQGGSSLTQQLAKNAFLEKDRTPWRKVKEAFLSIEIERQTTKRDILERYVNVVDYGHGCEGIGQAAQRYFRKRPAALTLAESALLVGLVPSPPMRPIALGRAERAMRAAFGRVGYFFPDRYPAELVEDSAHAPLTDLVER